MILTILTDEHPKLREKCKEVKTPMIHQELTKLMMEIVRLKQALGLAANQIGKSPRIIALRLDDFEGVMFNPVIEDRCDRTIGGKYDK